MDSEKTNHTEDSIDLVELLGKLWNERKLIFKSLIFSFGVGVLVSIISPVKYSASTVFVPKLATEAKGSEIFSLASIAGINLNSPNELGDISPTLYPNVATNIPFKLKLLNQPIMLETGESSLLGDYFESEISVFSSAKRTILKILKSPFPKRQKVNSNAINESIIFINEKQKLLMKALEKTYVVSLDESLGSIGVTAEASDPVVAAEIVRLVTSNLQEEIIYQRLEKVRNELEFTQKQYSENKLEFQKVQDNLAKFKDRNQNISSSLFKNELDRIQAEYSILLNVVTELATQVEFDKIQVNKDTPIFTVVEPVNIPLEHSKPKRLFLIIVLTLLGGIISSGWVLTRDSLIELKKEITKT